MFLHGTPGPIFFHGYRTYPRVANQTKTYNTDGIHILMSYIIAYLCQEVSIGGSVEGGVRDVCPIPVQFCFIFMQFSPNNWPNNRLAHTHLGGKHGSTTGITIST